MQKNRSINVIFISGAAGLGKTTFAKNYCETLKKTACISSSSNDPLQDYKGEPVLILDDMRDDSFRFHDFLKLLDNHTLSSSKSRYHNKAFIGDTIIITSTKPLADWYFNVPSEDKHQLYRRINQMYKIYQDKISGFEYNEKLCRYEPAGSVPNYITMSIQSKARLVCKVFDAMGLEMIPEDKDELEKIANPETYKEKCKKNIDEYLPEKKE